jgi:predicted thioesterase
VGTHINVSHRAPALLGERVVATARFQRAYKPKNSRSLRYVFETEARVGKRLLGAGTVERAVVEPHFSEATNRNRRSR